MSDPLLVVDAPSLLYRSFFALPDSIKGAGGKPVNALLGGTNAILRVVADRPVRAVVLCFGQEAAHYRKKLYPPYHADRPPAPDGLAHQFAEAERHFGAFGWPSVSHDELEADDLLGSYALTEEEAGGTALLFTGDRDMYQCASENTTVLYMVTGKQGFEKVGPGEVRQRYGVSPEQVPDFIALRGDPSDGLPGGKGIGEKTAADLLRRHGSLEGAIKGGLRETPRVRAALCGAPDELRAFLDIATLRRVTVKRPVDRPTDLAGGAAMARERGMNRLAERLEKAGAVSEL
jgi:DNA polymerase-1